MMALKIAREIIEQGGGTKTLDKAIKDFAKALKLHEKTVDVPAPTAHPMVMEIVRAHGGEYEIVEPPAPPELRKPAPLETIEEIRAREAKANEEAAEKLSIDDHRNMTLARLSAFKWSKVGEGVDYNGIRYWSDRASEFDIVAAILDGELQGETFAIKWKSADGQYPILGLDDLRAILRLIRAHKQTCFNREQRVAEKINGLKSAKALREFEYAGQWDKV